MSSPEASKGDILIQAVDTFQILNNHKHSHHLFEWLQTLYLLHHLEDNLMYRP